MCSTDYEIAKFKNEALKHLNELTEEAMDRNGTVFRRALGYLFEKDSLKNIKEYYEL